MSEPVHPAAFLDPATLAYVRESMVGIEAVGGTVNPIALIDSIASTRAELRGEHAVDWYLDYVHPALATLDAARVEPGASEGLRNVVEKVYPTLSHWSRDGLGAGWNTATEPHSEWCPPCLLRAALAASPASEGEGL